MDEVNVYGDEWTDGTEEPGSRNRERPLGEKLGAQKLGASGEYLRPGGARAGLLNREAANLEYFDRERE